MPKKILIAGGVAAIIAAGLAAFVWILPMDGLLNRVPDATEQRTDIADPVTSDHWRDATRAERLVTVWDPRNAERGFTLYTSGHAATAQLVTMIGHPMHEWTLPYSAAAAGGNAAVAQPQPDSLVFLRKARMFPNGDLIGLYEAAGHTPPGYGLVKVDKNSGIIWAYLQRVHSDFDLAPDGRVFVLAEDFLKEDDKPVILESYLTILTPDGREAAKLSLSDAFEASPFSGLLAPSRSAAPRATSIDVIDDAEATGLFEGRAGQALLSFPDLGVLAVIDPASGQITWAARGAWNGQYDASIVADGHILIFDNRGEAGDGKASRVLEIDPVTMTTVWSYTARPGQTPFASATRGSAERLPGGNTLITEADGGRLFEVDRSGTVVWEFTNPVRGAQGDARIPVVTSGQRIELYWLDADFRGFTRP
ncbi:arylsulfotransferase family protein [Iodidimonas sp. SYSU 1G8]|uniref:arylsulfotransferase family protein n=1 Tax=Iodidimonas sp. SYSU 1G8 TaxID=3133967 RepID=UPI0031FE6446